MHRCSAVVSSDSARFSRFPSPLSIQRWQCRGAWGTCTAMAFQHFRYGIEGEDGRKEHITASKCAGSRMPESMEGGRGS